MSDYFLADDLSGALDAAAAFHHAGREVTIALSPDNWPPASGDGVVGITTETRNAAPAAAAHAVRCAIEQGRARGGRLLYKKIDSTLRGPVAAELAALADALPDRRILFAPANPAAGRTVRDGVLLLHGIPVAQTEFARDPACPVKESTIRRLLGNVAADRIVIADAEAVDDLTAAVARMDATDEPWVAVGSGALARPVAARAAESIRASIRAKHILPPGPALMICGSAHPRNRAQAAILARERGVGIHELRVAEPAAVVEAARADLRAGCGTAILIEEHRRDRAAAIQAIVASVVPILAETQVRRIFATGGETAFAVCDALGISALTFWTEIEAGLSIALAEDGRGAHDTLLFAIKPGGFGDPQTWVRAWDVLSTA